MCTGVLWWWGQGESVGSGKCEQAGNSLANQEGCSRLDLWFRSGLGEFSLGKDPPNLMAMHTACFMEDDQSAEQFLTETTAWLYSPNFSFLP